MHDHHEHDQSHEHDEGENCCEEKEPVTLLQRRLGKTGVKVTLFGLGGRGLLKRIGREAEAETIIKAALDSGVNFFDTSRTDNSSEEYYGKALKGRRNNIFLSSKTASRSRAGAEADLGATLKALDTDYLDLWQLQDVRTEHDLEEIFAPGGAIEIFVEAKKAGTVRFIGVHGTHDPAVIKRCIERFDFDTVMIPVNPADSVDDSFVELVVPVASAKDMGIIAMDVMLDGMLNAPARLLISYALTQPVAVAVIGCDDYGQLTENVDAAGNMQVLTHKEIVRLRKFVSQFAGDIM